MAMTRQQRRQQMRRARKAGQAGAPDTSGSAPVAGPAGADRLRWLWLLVVAAGALAYLNSFGGVFLLDDNRHIVESQHFLDVVGRRPVVNLTLALSYGLSGLETWGYHLVNVAVHVLAGLVLFGVVRRTLLLPALRETWAARAPWLALAVAVVWVVHPLQTQSVTYIIQRAEALMGLFYLLTIYCVVRGATGTRPGLWYGAAVLAAGLGMGSKAVMVTAPAVVLLYDRVFLAGTFAAALRERWKLYASLVGSWLVLAMCGVVQGVLFGKPGRMTTVGFGFEGVSPGEYLVTQPGVILNYLWLSIWPQGLCLDYGWPVADTTGRILPALLVMTALGAVTLWAIRRRPELGFLGAAFFLILSPTSSIVPIRDLAFEHRMYLPLAAVVAAAVVGAHLLLRRCNAPGGVQVAVLAIVALALGARTVDRNADYHDAYRMWADVVSKSPANARAHTELANALDERGRVDEAVDHYEVAIRLDPTNFMGHNNLGIVLARLGRNDEAIAHYQAALTLDEKQFLTHNNMGNALVRANRVDEGIAHFERAIALKKSYPTAHNSLGVAFARLGRVDEAEKRFRRAIRLRPDFAEARGNLASVLRNNGDMEAAVDEYRRALEHKPDYFDGWFNLGSTLYELDRQAEATAAFREANRLRPGNPRARDALDRQLMN